MVKDWKRGCEAAILFLLHRKLCCLRPWHGVEGRDSFSAGPGDPGLEVSHAGPPLFPLQQPDCLTGHCHGGAAVRSQHRAPSESGNIFRPMETVSRSMGGADPLSPPQPQPPSRGLWEAKKIHGTDFLLLSFRLPENNVLVRTRVGLGTWRAGGVGTWSSDYSFHPSTVPLAVPSGG